MKDYRKILEGIVNIISNTEKSDTVSNICSYIDENCPELTESKNERIRKWLIEYFNDGTDTEISFNNDLKMEDILAWIEKQNQVDKVSYETAEKEKYDFVSGQYIECRKSFNEFKEDNSYWLEYVGNDTYIGRSDNILNQKFHITPKQLFCLFTQQHCPKENSVNEETNAPTEYGKYVDECLNEAAKHFFSEGEDKYSVADLFYAGVRCGKSWLEKQSKDKPDFRERYKKMTESEWFKKTYEDKSCGIDNVSVDETDKAKPKFHKGEWIIFNGSILLVNEVVQGYYKTISRDGIYNSYDWSIDYAARPWTIEDAKDGDVLTSYECYAIFKEIDGLNIKCYFTYHLNVGSIPTFYVNTLQNKTAFCPVSKEEREIFLKKVNELGYGWDCENKKLFKI